MKCNVEITIIMTCRLCSYCKSDVCYDNNDDKQSNGHWYSLATQDRRGIYFLCNNCYSKQQINTSKQAVYATWQNRKQLDIKQRISKLKASLMQRINFKFIG
jgi:hypothetical protein